MDRWAGWRTNVFSTTNVLARLDRLVATLTEPAARNFERWPILGVLVGPEYFEGTNYLSEIQNLRDWTTNRFAWIDAQLVPPPVISHAVGGSNNTEVVSFAATNGQVFSPPTAPIRACPVGPSPFWRTSIKPRCPSLARSPLSPAPGARMVGAVRCS